MFDLEFTRVVKKVLKWTGPAPPTRFANEHESYVNHKNNLGTMLDVADTMASSEILLHMYVQGTYPIYFGLERCHTGQCFAKHYNSSIPEY